MRLLGSYDEWIITRPADRQDGNGSLFTAAPQTGRGSYGDGAVSGVGYPPPS